MAITQDLFMAILSMDAYNRGYGAGIEDGIPGSGGLPDGLGEAGYRIGNAEIKDVDLPNGSQAAGFYALANEWQGQTVISYRGTDQLLSNLWSDDVGSDIWNAYLGGAGEPVTQQSVLAAQFYQAATLTTETNPAAANWLLQSTDLLRTRRACSNG